MAARNETYTATIKVNAEQAHSEIARLEKEKTTLEQRMMDLAGKKDAQSRKERDQLRRDLKDINRQLNDQRRYASGLNSVLGGLSTKTYKDLKNEVRQLNKLMRDGTIEKGSAEWREMAEHIKRCKREMKEYEAAVEDMPKKMSAWERSMNFLNKNWGAITQVFAAISGISLTIRKAVQDFAKMEEAMADTRKYTGLTDEAIRDLNEDLKKMDTRTSREELNDLAGAAGRLGKTAKQDILEFVDAGNMIKVALGDDLGEDAIDKVGKLAMAFGEDEKMGLRGAMLATGSAVNELAQNSSAQAGYLVDFTARVAGFGKQLGLTQAQIMGFGAVMDENLLRDEMAATAFGNMLTKMQLDTEKFAKIAGMNVKEFTKLLNEDANEAILRLADSLKRADSQTMMKMLDDMGLDGSRAVGVLATLADKVDDVRARQQLATKAYKEGTSVLEEYNTMNNTVEAGIEKAKKQFMEMSVELGRKLEPAVKYTISSTALLAKGLSALITFLSQNYKMLLSLVVLIGLYNAAKLKKIALEKLDAAWTKTVEVADKALIATKTLLRSALLALELAWTRVTKGAMAYKRAMVAARAASLTNPWTALLTVLTGVGIAIYALVKAWNSHTKALREQEPAFRAAKQHAKDMADISKKVNSDIAKEVATIQHLTTVIRSNAYSINERRSAIDQLQKIVPEYHASISNEGVLIETNTQKLQDYITELKNAAKAQAYMDKMTEIAQAKLDNELKLARKQNNLKAVDAELERGERMGDKNPYKSEKKLVPVASTVPGGPGSSVEIETNDKLIDKLKEREHQQKAVNEALKEQEVLNRRQAELEKQMRKDGIMNQVTVTGSKPAPTPTPAATFETDADKKRRQKEEEDRKKQLKERAEAAKASWQEQVAEEMLAYQQGISSYTNYMEEKHNLTQNYYDELKRIYGEDSNEYKKALLQQARDEQEYNSWKIKQDDDSLLRDKLEIEHRIRMQYAQQTVRDDRQMNEALFQNEIAYLKKKRNLYKDGSKEQMDIDMQILQKENQHKYKKEKEWTERISKYKAEANKLNYDELMKMELQGIQDVHEMLIAAGQLTEEEYTKIIENIKRKYAELKAEAVANSDVQKDASGAVDIAKKTVGAKQSDAGDNIATGIFSIVQAVENQRRINDELENMYKEGLITFEQYEEAKRQVAMETSTAIVAGAQAALNTINSLLSAASSYAQACSDLELAKITKNYDRQIKAAGNNEKKKQKLEEERDKKIRDAKNKANKRAMAIEMAQAIATTALTALQAYQTGMQAGYPAGLVLGPVAAGLALAAGAIQIATIKKAHEAEAEGYYEGGFTGGHRYRKEAGVVHEGEFVANHQAVNNPQLMPVLSLIDQAQRNNRVGQLRAEDVTNVMGGAASAAVVAPVVNVQNDNSELQEGLGELHEVVENLSGQLESGLHVIFVFDGPEGFESNYRKYKKLKS